MSEAHAAPPVPGIGSEGRGVFVHPRATRTGVIGWFGHAGLVALALACASLSAEPASAATYYVDANSPTCSSAGPGTPANPYCTITAAVAARKGPGITIVVKPGTYREQVSIPASGAAGNPYVLIAEGRVVLDGADDFADPAKWVQHVGNVWKAAGVTWTPLQVFEGEERYTELPATDPASIATGGWRYVAGEGLYLNAGGGNPGLHPMFVSRRSYGFRVSGRSYVSLIGFTVLHSNDKGIALASASSNVLLQSDTTRFSFSYGVQADACSAVEIRWCVSSGNANHGFGLNSGTTGSIIADCQSYENAKPATRVANGIYVYQSPGNRIERNQLRDNQNTGVDVQTSSNNTVLLQNLSYRNGHYGYNHTSNTGGIHVGDVAWGNFDDGFSIGTSASGTQLHNCIASENGLFTNGYDLSVSATAVPGFVSDYNLFDNSGSQPPFRYNGSSYPSLASYAAVSGQEAHSFEANPGFVNPAANDFHVGAGSPAIDSGNSGAPEWPATDADGLARVDAAGTVNTGAGPVAYADRGALEYGAVDLPPDVTAISTVYGIEGSTIVLPVTAVDPDGDPILAFSAVLSGLPAGNDAAFTTSIDRTAGTFTWTPGVSHSGSYTVKFIATSTKSDTATTTLIVANYDFPPLVTAPTHADFQAPAPVQFTVTAGDPDGEPVASLVADFSGLPAGHNATFVSNPQHTQGTFTWTPTMDDVGEFTVRFIATNSLADTAATLISAQPWSDEIHWTILGPTSVAMHWRGSSNTVRYGLTSGYGSVVHGVTPTPYPWSSAGPFWEATITGLSAGTTYHYATPGAPDHTFHTAPAPRTSNFSVYVQGDIGDTASYRRVAPIQAKIASDLPAFVLMVGDLTYGDAQGPTAVDAHFNDVMGWSRDAAYMPAWGNHEWDNEPLDDLRNYKGRFILPNARTSPGAPATGCCGEDWYWFDYGNIRFIAYPEPYSGAWDDWEPRADSLMDAAQGDPGINFIVTFGHRPAYSSGHHPGEQRIREILDALGATHWKYVLNLNGHSHNYERTYPQSRVTHITAGASGSGLEIDFNADSTCLWLGGCPPPGYTAYRAMHHGILKLQFQPQSIKGQFFCGPAGGTTSNQNDITCTEGAVIDSFTIATPTGVAVEPAAPARFEFAMPAPNPFARLTNLSFRLPVATHVRLGIYDVHGRLVQRLIDGEQAAGEHHAVWSGRDSEGLPVPSGIYFGLVEAGPHRATRRLIFVR